MSRKSKRRFWGKLKTLGYESYGQYLASEHWADVRRRFWAKNRNRRCRAKGCEAQATEIHHKTYKRLGAEHIGIDLYGLCREHHQAIHDAEEVLPERWGLWGISKAVAKKPGFVKAYRKKQERRQKRAQELDRLIKEQAQDMRDPWRFR